jgi:hypothetical protein
MTTEVQQHEHHDFKFIIDHKHHTWPQQFITGLELKKIAGVDAATYSVWQQLKGAEDPEIADDGKADLGPPGTEKFFTGKKHTTEG